jgi:hypothetical protein
MPMILMTMQLMMYRKPMMDGRRLWMTEGKVRESVTIILYMSDRSNKIMAKQMQWQAMYLKRRLHCKM